MSSFVPETNIHPYDIIMHRLIQYPKKAKYIQLDKAVLEDLLKEYEQIEIELAELSEELE